MRVVSAFVLLLLLVLAVVVALPFTAAGSRLLIERADQLDAIAVEYSGGQLFGELELGHFRYESEALKLELKSVQTVLRPGCFWRSAFCLETAQIEAFNLQLVATENETSEDGSKQAQMIELPYPVSIEKVRLGSAHIGWPGGYWQQGTMQASLSLVGSVLAIEEASVQAARLHLAANDESSPGYPGFALPSIYLPLDLQVDRLELLHPQADIGDAEYPFEFLTLSGRWVGYSLELAGLDTRSEQYGELNGTGEIAFQGAWPLQLETTAVVGANVAAEALRNRIFGLSLSGSFQQMIVSVHSEGSPTLSLEGEAGVSLPDLPLSADWTLQWQESVSLAEIAQLEGTLGELQLVTPIDGSVTGTLDEQQIELRGQLAGLGYEQLELVAAAGWQAPRLQLHSLELSDSASDSRLSAEGMLQLTESWEVQASATTAGFQLPAAEGKSLARLEGKLSLRAEGEADSWTIRLPEVQLQGVVADQPAYIHGYAGITSSLRLLPSKLEGDISGAQLRVEADAQGTRARVELVLDDIGRWVPGGQGHLSLLARGDPSTQHLEFEGSAQQFQVAGQKLSDARFSGMYSVEREVFNARLQATDIEAGGLALDEVSLQLRGAPEAHRIAIKAEGDVDGRITLEGGFADGRWQGQLQPALISTSSGDWQLGESVALSWDPGAGLIDLDPHCWKHKHFDLCGRRLNFGSTGDVALRLAGNARAINGFLPQGLRTRGQLQADVQLGWLPGKRMEFSGKASATDFRVTRAYGMGERVSTQWDKIDLDVSGDTEGLKLRGVGRSGDREIVSVIATLPVDTASAIDGTLRLDRLWVDNLAPFTSSFSKLGGSVSGELKLSGSIDVPKANGVLTLSDGHFVSLDNPTELTELQLELKLAGDTGTISGEGALGGGPLQLEGTLTARPDYRLDLQLSGARHQILVPPASDFIASEEIRLVLTDGLMDISGEIRIHEGVLRHDELPAGGVALSNDAVLVDVNGNVLKEEVPFEVRSDVWIRIKDRFKIEGESLHATLGGDLHVVREPGNPPQVFGTLNLMGGELRAYRQQLLVQRGTIAFSGPPENPELNISAEREIRSEDVMVGARLFGPLEQPELEIYSTPAMSQGEAMSYLVRGRGLDSGAGADGTALALSVGADIVNQSGIVTEINRLPLISDVAFGASGEDDETAATVSAYVGSRIYVSYGIGLYEPINILTARLYLQSRLWLEVVSSLENSLDLYYSFDID